MLATDEQAFGAIFLQLRGVLAPFKADKAEIRVTISAYFAILRPWSLHVIRLGADHCAATMKKFPKPAEWIEAIPKAKGAGLPPLSDELRDDYRTAESHGFEANPCTCHLCRQAGISDRPLRYVPDTNPDGSDLRRADGDKIITLGHWAHGDELASFYAARDRFWHDFSILVGKRSMVAVSRPALAHLDEHIDDSMAANPEDAA